MENSILDLDGQLEERSFLFFLPKRTSAYTLRFATLSFVFSCIFNVPLPLRGKSLQSLSRTDERSFG